MLTEVLLMIRAAAMWMQINAWNDKRDNREREHCGLCGRRTANLRAAIRSRALSQRLWWKAKERSTDVVVGCCELNSDELFDRRAGFDAMKIKPTGPYCLFCYLNKMFVVSKNNHLRC